MVKTPDEYAALDARIREREKLARTFACYGCGALPGEKCRQAFFDASGERKTETVAHVCGRRYRLAVEKQQQENK